MADSTAIYLESGGTENLLAVHNKWRTATEFMQKWRKSGGKEKLYDYK